MNAPTLKFVEGLARAAGEITLRYFRKQFKVTDKGHHLGFVTDADLASEKYVTEEIRRHFPAHDILAEESGLTRATAKENTLASPQPLWLIDPLDGTNNFSRGNPYYNVSIAFGYLQNNSFQQELAVVFQPTANDLFSAQKGKGANWNGTPLKISSLTDFGLGSFFTGFGPLQGHELKENLDRIQRIQGRCKSTAVRINGAAALDLAWVAAGICHGFWETKLSAWDTGAGTLIVKEAGGKVTNFLGEDFDPLRDRDVMATLPAFYPEFFQCLTGGQNT